MKLPDFDAVLETERCFLKIPEESDAETMWNLISENTTQYLIWEKWENYLTSLKNIISSRKDALEWVSWASAVYDKNTRKIIGRCGIVRADPATKSFEIWYWITESYYGKWLIPECVLRIVAYMFEVWDFEKWIIRCDANNMNSQKVALKCWFQHEWTLRKYELMKWKLRDTKFFGITREDYFSQS